jgi:pSer/pThr/pTyr-binding forkhead associated (FHA) protein
MAVLVQINSFAGVNVAIEGSPFRIGRGEENDLRIDDDLASRDHALIDCREDPQDATRRDWILRDRESTNGTYVNDRRITVHALVDGDVVRIGKSFFKFFAGEHANPGETLVLMKSIIPGVYYTKDKGS